LATTERRTTAGAKFEMEQSITISDERGALASGDDVKRILGDLDDAKLLEIMALHPTILDVQETSLWSSKSQQSEKR
jgi:hypothetical protein